MRTSIKSTTAILAIMLSTTFGCQGQRHSEPTEEAQASSVAVPFDLGLSTYLSGPATPITFDVDSRFILNTTKERLRTAKTIYDIVPADPRQEIVSYASVSIRIFKDEKQTDIVAIGDGPELNAAQQKLLRSLDYSDSFLIRAEFTEKSGRMEGTNWNYSSPHVTIVPEVQALNSSGKEALIAHVKAGTSGFGYVVEADKLRPGKVRFTVNTAGKIEGVQLSSSSGYATFDQRMIDLIRTLPGTWEPARNANGDKVDQEFVFSFGTVGC